MDLIYAARYTEACDYAWHDYADTLHKDNLQPGVWHVDTASIPEFFKMIRTSRHKYVVVSPSCDFGVCVQRYNHPAMDLEKWLSLQMTPRHGYRDLQMQARIDPKRCDEKDHYSIKCWSYTAATFPEIPDNVVKWYVCNCEIDDPRVVPIPFGVGGNKDMLEGVKAIDSYKTDSPRDKLLYVNFQFYNTDRYKLFLHIKNNFPSVTCKQQVPFDEFLHDMATHKYVLCPPGNGLDCYRTLESIYMGAIPILERRMGCVMPYNDVQYPILAYPNLFQIDPIGLEASYNMYNNMDRDCTKAKWPYWKQQIDSSRSLIG